MKLIKGGGEVHQRVDWGGIYFRIMKENAARYLQSKQSVRHCYAVKTIWAAVKYLGLCKAEGSVRELAELLSLRTAVMNMMAELTPQEVIRLFPPQKEYHGGKWGVKDYFSCMDAVRATGIDKPLGEYERVQEFLWEIMNRDIRKFITAGLQLLDAIRRLHGDEDLISGFFKSQGKRPPEMIHKIIATDGEALWADAAGHILGKVKKCKRRPKWIRAVK